MTEQITDVDPSSAALVPVGDEIVPAGGGALVSASAAPARAAHAHPEPRQYVLIAVVLVVITGMEVATSYLEGDVNSNLLIAALGMMAAVKFFLVVAWFMHLRTDSKILRRFFLLGLIAAPILYTIVLLMFHVFNSNV
jgi:cytochrome c oxidase subunit 4